MSLLNCYRGQGKWGNRGEAESTRVRLLQEAIVAANTQEIAAAACYDVSVNVCTDDTVCTDVNVETILQISPAEDRWSQTVPISPIDGRWSQIVPAAQNTFSIAVDPEQNSYVISIVNLEDSTYFRIHSYDVNGALRASFSQTPIADTTWWRHYDTIILWDRFASRLFVAELVLYRNYEIRTNEFKARIYAFDSTLQITAISAPLVSSSIYNPIISFMSNQQGRLFLYMQYNGVYIYDIGLTIVKSGPQNALIFTNFYESGCDAAGNALYVFGYQNNFIIQSIDTNASLLWSMTITAISNNPEVRPPSSLLISPDMLRFFYVSGTTILMQTISLAGTLLTSTTLFDAPPPFIEFISTAQNANGRIFLYINTEGACTLRELNGAGSILWSIPIMGTIQFLRALRCNNQYLWLTYADTEFQLRQFLLERTVQVTERVCETAIASNCNTAIVSICKTCLTPPPPPQIQEPTTPNQLSFILDRAVACPTRYVTPYATSGCQPLYTASIPPLTGPDVEPPQGPAVVTVYRKFPRIGGIDDISKPLVGRSSSDRTARIRAGIISQSQTRYVQTVLPVVPYPARPSNPPQPGVPVAPMNGCNPGARRVDFSNPRS